MPPKAKEKPGDIPQSAKNAERSKFLSKANKRKATKKARRKLLTQSVTKAK